MPALILCLLLALFGCDLAVMNPNDPDTGRVLRNSSDLESLVAGSYNTWFNGIYSDSGPGLFLSNQSFQQTAAWGNNGMEVYGRLPREFIRNDVADKYYVNFARPWYHSYRAIAAVCDGLSGIAAPEVAAELGPAAARRDRAFGAFVLGLGHATVALLYDQGFIIDEKTRRFAAAGAPQAPQLRPYPDVMAAGLAHFDSALALTEGDDFRIPRGWMPTDADLTAPEFRRVIHSLKARYLAGIARTSAERAAVDWERVIREVDAGITSSFVEDRDWNHDWADGVAYWAGNLDWSQVTYFVWGMADQSGNYQRWVGAAPPNRHPILDGKNVLIVTPDLRFPRGNTQAEQAAGGPGRYIGLRDLGGYSAWARPERGTWRWSHYTHTRLDAYAALADFHRPEIPISEMRMLKAEALYRLGDAAGAAALVNVSRVEIGGLNPTDAQGSNTSCVPRLPDGSCGGLFEMIKWEKRVEGAFQGLFGAPWFFDARGWGDLYRGTPLQFPIPCGDLQTLGLPCYTFGGPVHPSAAPLSSYRYPDEA